MKRKYPGFTIVEVSIVIAVLAILLAITITAYTGVQRQSRDSSRTNNARIIMDALNRYYNDKGEYPAVCPGGDNSGCSVTLLEPSLVPSYIPSIPKDPSGRSFSYVRGLAPNKSYGLLISYEASSICKTGQSYSGNLTYNSSSNTWWGAVSVVPICTTPEPYAG